MRSFKTITGKQFKKKYLSTASGFFENVRMAVGLGCALGDGIYLSVSEDSASHYRDSKYAVGGISYWELSDEAVIMLAPNGQETPIKTIRSEAKRLNADGVFDSNEVPFGRKTSPYLGLVIYNKKVISCVECTD